MLELLDQQDIEFIYVEDLADALIFLMNNYDDTEIVNVGVGRDVSIKELVAHIVDVVGYEGKVGGTLANLRYATASP